MVKATRAYSARWIASNMLRPSSATKGDPMKVVVSPSAAFDYFEIVTKSLLPTRFALHLLEHEGREHVLLVLSKLLRQLNGSFHRFNHRLNPSSRAATLRRHGGRVAAASRRQLWSHPRLCAHRRRGYRLQWSRW